MNVAHQHAAVLLERRKLGWRASRNPLGRLAVRNAVDPYIDHNRAGPHEFGGEKRRLAHRRDQKIRPPAHTGKIARLRVANRHRGVSMQQHQRHRLAHDIGAAHHHGFRPRNRYARALQQLHHPCRCAGTRPGRVGHKLPHVVWMETIYILVGTDRQQHGARVHLLRQRHLHQDPVDVLPLVEVFNVAEQFLRRDRIRQPELFAVHPQLAAGLHFARHIKLAGRIVARKNGYQPGRPPRGCKPGDAGLELFQNLLLNCLPVQDAGHDVFTIAERAPPT